MALVDETEYLEFLQQDEDQLYIIQPIIAHVEKWISTFCNRIFESTSYKERYDGFSDSCLLVDQYPITAVTLLSSNTLDAISVKNTIQYTRASISVSSSGITLSKDGVNTLLLFATYTTFALIVAAINAQSGWHASLMGSNYSDFQSNYLLEKFGLNCIDNNEVYLQMPDDGEDDFEVYPEEGKIYNSSGFPLGKRNIYIEYTAGYVSMPEDLKLAAKILAKVIYEKQDQSAFGLNSYSLGGISMSLMNDMPSEVISILSKYKRWKL
jgi:hypothetical protein